MSNHDRFECQTAIDSDAILQSHRQIARKLKISASVVSKWRCELVEQGLLPENEKITSVDVEDWTPERRFSVVLETATLSEMELADYCRRMGLFVEQVKEWRAISIQAHEKKLTENIRTDRALRDAKNKLRELEKELKRKDNEPPRKSWRLNSLRKR